MSDRLLDLLMQMTLAATLAVLSIAPLRKVLRRFAGARISYWLWAAAPATALALLVSALLPEDWMRAEALPPRLSIPLQGTLSTALSHVSSVAVTHDDAAVILWVWLAGVMAIAALFAHRQRSFIRSLGSTRLDSEGMLRSERVTTPMLIGAWRPRVLIPANFETLYSDEERVVMLTHEQAHRERGDALANACAVGWLCMFWFNPLMYWAWLRFRFDQELACDAYVLSRNPFDKRRYADALLNAQLKSESAWLAPVGCHWKSSHPLKERIVMLNRTSPTTARRIGGTMLAFGAIAFSALASFAGFADSPRNSLSLADGASSDMKIAVDAQDMNTRDAIALIAGKSNQNILVSDKVTGKITLHLKDVTWREALHIVTLSQGLVATQDGNVTIVDVAH